MYRVSPFVRHFAAALAGGAGLATLAVNLAPDRYYDAIEYRLFDITPPGWLHDLPVSVTPMLLVSHVLMPFFMGFVGKELWEALALRSGALGGRRAIAPIMAVAGGVIGAVLVWTLTAGLIETAEEAGFATGWPVPIGGDVVLAYVVARGVFGPGHPALHLTLLLTIGFDILGLLTLGLADPQASLRLVWLALPALAVALVWQFFGRDPGPFAPEARRRRGMALWPYVLAGFASWLGFAAAGLPAALAFLPVIPAIPHADRSFGLFSEAEEFLHDPLNRLAHAMVKPLIGVLFLFGLTRGGIDFAAFAPTTVTTLAALWIGKPLGLLAGLMLAGMALRAELPPGVRLRDMALVALISGMGFTVPVLALESAIPGGGMAEAARLGLALSLGAGALALGLARARRRGRPRG